MTAELILITNLLIGIENVENWKNYGYFGNLAKNAYFGMTRGSRKIQSETLSPKTISNDC